VLIPPTLFGASLLVFALLALLSPGQRAALYVTHRSANLFGDAHESLDRKGARLDRTDASDWRRHEAVGRAATSETEWEWAWTEGRNPTAAAASAEAVARAGDGGACG
jgi:hypothetical protein